MFKNQLVRQVTSRGLHLQQQRSFKRIMAYIDKKVVALARFGQDWEKKDQEDIDKLPFKYPKQEEHQQRDPFPSGVSREELEPYLTNLSMEQVEKLTDVRPNSFRPNHIETHINYNPYLMEELEARKFVYVENKSTVDEDGNELLVVYEVDEQFKKNQYRDIRMQLNRVMLGFPFLGICYFMPSYIGIISGIYGVIHIIRYILKSGRLAALPSKITVCWPKIRDPRIDYAIQDSLHRDDPFMFKHGYSVPYATEFQQMAGHNESIRNETEERLQIMRRIMATKIQTQTDDVANATMGIVEHPMFPSLLFEKVEFNVALDLWRAVEDPGFPQYIYIERIGFNEKRKLFGPMGKCRISEMRALWIGLTTPKILPMVTQEVIEKCQIHKYNAIRIGLTAEFSLVNIYPKYVRSVEGINMLIVAANLNSYKDQHEVVSRIHAPDESMDDEPFYKHLHQDRSSKLD